MPAFKAAALNYDRSQQGVPKVVAVGEGPIAEKILSIAKKYNIPIVENTKLVQKLVKYSPGTEIPAELYETVAKILAYIYSLEKNRKL